jgi:5-methylcytosine-specific restriction enzyme A
MSLSRPVDSGPPPGLSQSRRGRLSTRGDPIPPCSAQSPRHWSSLIICDLSPVRVQALCPIRGGNGRAHCKRFSRNVGGAWQLSRQRGKVSPTPGAGNVGPSCSSGNIPLCSMCLARNIVTPAMVADHITPHHGDHQLFYFGNLQSLCQHCHSHRKKGQETHGYQCDVGLDGWPTDPNHPANKPSPPRGTR